MSRGDDAPRRMTKRLAWFVALWVGGVLVVGVVAYGLRLFIP